MRFFECYIYLNTCIRHKERKTDIISGITTDRKNLFNDIGEA